MFAKFFIDRPIFATVLSLLIVLGGIVGLVRLPVALYPEVAPPTIEVSAVYPGANAQDLVAAVAAPIEQQVNGVENMMYMSSNSGNDGTYTLTVTFKPGTDLNIAQVLVQNRVNLAERVLPEIVRRRGVSVKKKSTGQLLIVNLHSPDRRLAHAAFGGAPVGFTPGILAPEQARTDLYLSNYATIQLRDELARIDGVGDIQFFGQRDYSMRIWLDPDKLAGRNLTASDAVHAIEQQNAQVAAGQIGQPPAPTGQIFQYTINTMGRLTDPSQFSDIVIKTDADGRPVKLRDVTSRVELGAVGYDQVCTLDGRPSVGLAVYQLPGSNALETGARVKTKMAELEERFPVGVKYAIVYDTTPFVEESVREVAKTLIEAVILVAGVILLFLRSWRAAIIPLAAVPVAIVGTFGIMALLGYSLNALTLFGLVLAVGIVVDDAIVVVEAVEHNIGEGMAPKDATVRAMQQVSGPVIAVGLVLAAVFVPCLFITGIIGQFFRQFAVAIAISTLLSAFNSLTLSPALCGILLKKESHGKFREPLPRLMIPLAFAVGAFVAARHFAPLILPHLDFVLTAIPAKQMSFLHPWLPELVGLAAALVVLPLGWLVRVVVNKALGWAFWLFNAAFEVVTKFYLAIVRLAIKLSPLVLLGFVALALLTVLAMVRAPAGFIPNQDKGYLLVNVQLPDGASLARSERVVAQVDEISREIPGVNHTIAVAGQSQLLGANAPNFGTVYVMLDPFEDRAGDRERSIELVAERLQAACDEKVSGAVVTVFGAPPVEGLGSTGGVKLMILDRGDPQPQLLQSVAEATVERGNRTEQLRGVYTGYRADTPWLELRFDREQAEATGLPVENVIRDLQVLYGSDYVNDFNRFGRTWQVNVQADASFRNERSDPRRLILKTRSGKMVSLGGFAEVRETRGPVMMTRYNLMPAAAVTAQPAPGVSSGQAIDALHATATENLAPEMKLEWTELALLQLQSGNTAILAFMLSVVLVFLVLAAQYESWALPLAVILVVPLCLLSAVAGVLIGGHDVNVFTQVGFIVLIGLACKNSILIVEYARARHEAGATPKEATLDACRLRFRPIVMTSLAFILGVVPLLFATGAGSEMRQLLGTAVFAGMVGVTLFGVFLTPVFFFVIQSATKAIRR